MAVRFWRTPLRAGMMGVAMEVAMMGVMEVMTGVVMVEVMEEEATKAFAYACCFRDKTGDP